MKGFKILAVLLALLTALSCFAACGDSGKNTETTTPDKDTSLPEQKLDEWGREYIDDTVPKDLSFADKEDNTLTFFTRSNDSYWAIEMDIICDMLETHPCATFPIAVIRSPNMRARFSMC